MLKYLKGDRLDSRIRSALAKICTILGLSALLGVICMFILSSWYDKVLTNYAFSQGDIGMAMTLFTETHDNLSSAIGFTVKEDIDAMVEEYEYNKKQYEHFLSIIEPTMVTPEGHSAFDEITRDSNEYWELSDQLLVEGSVSDMQKI